MLCSRDKYLCIYTARMSPADNRSSALQCFEHNKAIEICNGLMFHFFCLGLSDMYVVRPTILEVVTSTSNQYSSK